MISAFVLSPSLGLKQPDPRAAEAVARSLGALVRATVEGIVRDAVVIGPATDKLDVVADRAGCANIEAPDLGAGLAAGLRQTRGDIILLLTGGFAPPRAFVEEASDLLLEGAEFSATLLRRAPYSLATRLAPGLAQPVGLLALRSQISQISGARGADLSALIRATRPRRTLTQRAIKMV